MNLHQGVSNVFHCLVQPFFSSPKIHWERFIHKLQFPLLTCECFWLVSNWFLSPVLLISVNYFDIRQLFWQLFFLNPSILLSFVSRPSRLHIVFARLNYTQSKCWIPKTFSIIKPIIFKSYRHIRIKRIMPFLIEHSWSPENLSSIHSKRWRKFHQIFKIVQNVIQIDVIFSFSSIKFNKLRVKSAGHHQANHSAPRSTKTLASLRVQSSHRVLAIFVLTRLLNFHIPRPDAVHKNIQTFSSNESR